MMGWGVNDYPTDPEKGVNLKKKELHEFQERFDVDYLNSFIDEMNEEERASLVYAVLHNNKELIANLSDEFYDKTGKDYDDLNPDDDRWMYEERK